MSGKDHKSKVLTPQETKKAPYRVPVNEGLFAPREPATGAVPPPEALTPPPPARDTNTPSSH